MNKCPNIQCGRTGDDIGQCGSHATCPRQAVPVEVTDVVLHCPLCEFTRVVPAATIIKGKALSEAHMCLTEVCQARPIMQAAPKVASDEVIAEYQHTHSPQPASKAAKDGKGQK